MTFVENLWSWLSSAGISVAIIIAILAAIWRIFRDVILTNLREKLGVESQKELQSRQHQFEKKCEEVRQDFTMKEKLLISILDVSSERSKAISQRKLEAVEAIWESINKLNTLLLSNIIADRIDFEVVDKLEEIDRKKMEIFAQPFIKDFDSDFLKSVNCTWTRLYVSETAWAFYHAYFMILSFSALQMKALELGQPVSALTNKEPLRKAILDALPHQKSTFEKFPDLFESIFLEELREAVLRELKRTINGDHPTKEELDRAKAILAEVENIPKPKEKGLSKTPG